ncbi:MAG: DinB family protein [Cyclobacteriaceae bacterium]
MKESIENRFQKLIEETDLVFRDLQGIEESDLKKKGKGWSIIQVLSHLNMSEGLSLQYMNKKVQAGKEMQEVNFINNFKMWVVCGFLGTGLKWKAPSYISNPEGNYTLDEIRKIWEATRSEIRNFIEQYPEELLNHAVYKHPMAGRLSLEQAVDSFVYHQRHHVYQLRRIRKELNI